MGVLELFRLRAALLTGVAPLRRLVALLARLPGALARPLYGLILFCHRSRLYGKG